MDTFISGSIILPGDIRDLRDLTEHKETYWIYGFRKNRVHKVVEDANIRISSVVSEVFGVSSLNMVILLKDELTIEEIAGKEKGKLKKDKTISGSP